ncbi:MAG: biotin/lipoyl-binding protein [Peptococcaceae bacterium]|nr:biotin/lipoyl-binding protein [Peptococcaceae bacterium]
MTKYLNVKTIGVGVLTFLVLCFFLSKTIYTFNMPQITATIPFTGKLSKTETANGIAEWYEVERVLFESASKVEGKVEEVFVKEGDEVTKGQQLMRLSFNHDDTYKRINELKITQARLELDIENIHLKIDKANDDLTNVLEEQERELDKVQSAFDRAKTLYDAEAATTTEMETAEYNLQTTVAKYEKQINDLKLSLTNNEQELKAKQLDIDNNAIQLKPYQDLLATNGRINAPAAGIVGELNVAKGDLVNTNQCVLTIGIGQMFSVVCNIPLENSFVFVNDTCRLTNSIRSLNGTVEKIVLNNREKAVHITVTSDNIMPGESFNVTFSKQGERNERLVANGAVMQDSNGYFLHRIKQRKGVLGNEYYTEKLRIYIGDSDDTNTVILNDIGFFEPVVLSGNKSFAEGDTITLKNGSDFFARN